MSAQDTSSTGITTENLAILVDASPKRRKIEDDAGSTLYSAVSNRCSELWYDDGTIILKTGVTLHRVYEGIISQHSKVLRDIFAQAKYVGRLEDIDAIPVVELDDDPIALQQLLKALHDRSFYNPHRANPFKTSASLLKLSVKYSVQVIRDLVLTNLRTYYSDKLATLDALNVDGTRGLVQSPDSIQMIALAQEHVCLVLLPAAFLQVIRMMTKLQRQGDRSKLRQLLSQLSVHNLATCLIAQQKLATALQVTILKFLGERSSLKCTSRQACAEEKANFMASPDYALASKSKLCALHIGVEAYVLKRVKLCAICRSALSSCIEEGRERVWEEFPSYLGLPSWKTMRRAALSTHCHSILVQ